MGRTLKRPANHCTSGRCGECWACEATPEWNQATHPLVGKFIDTSFTYRMVRREDYRYCNAVKEWWDFEHPCDRQRGHTGRHMAMEFKCRYPIGVWR